jgi:hypothetical protein
LETFSDNPEIVKFTITMFTRLATDDDLSEAIAETGMGSFMAAVATHFDDTIFLTLLFELFGQLAFVKTNLKAIVQHGGIRVLMDTMATYTTDAELMDKSIQTVDNIVSADEEYATIVMEKGGKDAIEEVKQEHEAMGNSEVVASCNAAILSMTAMARVKERDGTKVNRGALFARLGGLIDVQAATQTGANIEEEEACPEGDPLQDYRNLLRSGQVIKEFASGGSRQKHIFVAVDWQSILVKDTAKRAKTGQRLPLRNLRKAVAGYGDNHHKKGVMGGTSVRAEESKCFHLIGAKGQDELSVECASAQDCERWVNGINMLLKVSRKWPAKLVGNR